MLFPLYTFYFNIKTFCRLFNYQNRFHWKRLYL